MGRLSSIASGSIGSGAAGAAGAAEISTVLGPDIRAGLRKSVIGRILPQVSGMVSSGAGVGALGSGAVSAPVPSVRNLANMLRSVSSLALRRKSSARSLPQRLLLRKLARVEYSDAARAIS